MLHVPAQRIFPLRKITAHPRQKPNIVRTSLVVQKRQKATTQHTQSGFREFLSLRRSCVYKGVVFDKFLIELEKAIAPLHRVQFQPLCVDNLSELFV